MWKKNLKKSICICISDSLWYTAVTQHCKSTILQNILKMKRTDQRPRTCFRAGGKGWPGEPYPGPRSHRTYSQRPGLFPVFSQTPKPVDLVVSPRKACCPAARSCLTLWDPVDFPVLRCLPEFVQTHVHQVGDAMQPSHPLSPPSPPAPSPSQHQGLFQWVSSSH